MTNLPCPASMQEKVNAILNAVESGNVTGSQLEPSRRGATVSKLKTGKPVHAATVDKLYSRLMNLDSGKSIPRSITKSITIDAIVQELAILKEIMSILEKENCGLKARLESLESEKSIGIESPSITSIPAMPVIESQSITSIPAMPVIESQSITKNVLGFSLAKSRKGFWYAVKRFGACQVSVYVGKNPQEAEGKIRAYCQRKGIEVDNL